MFSFYESIQSCFYIPSFNYINSFTQAHFLLLKLCSLPGSPVLKAGNVYNHIWHVMSNHTMRSWFCNEYTNVLVKNFLTVEVHKWEITPKLWHGWLQFIYHSFTGRFFIEDQLVVLIS